MKSCFKSKCSALEQKRKVVDTWKCRFLFLLEKSWKPRRFWKMPWNRCYSCHGEKKKKKWSFLILLTLLFLLTYSLGQSVPKGVRGQKASSFWFQGCDWKIGDKQMQNMANCKVKPLPKQSALVWELKLWYCFCYPARGLYVNILFCTVLGWFLTLWPRMVQMHFPLS